MHQHSLCLFKHRSQKKSLTHSAYETDHPLFYCDSLGPPNNGSRHGGIVLITGYHRGKRLNPTAAVRLFISHLNLAKF